MSENSDDKSGRKVRKLGDTTPRPAFPEFELNRTGEEQPPVDGEDPKSKERTIAGMCREPYVGEEDDFVNVVCDELEEEGGDDSNLFQELMASNPYRPITAETSLQPAPPKKRTSNWIIMGIVVLMITIIIIGLIKIIWG